MKSRDLASKLVQRHVLRYISFETATQSGQGFSLKTANSWYKSNSSIETYKYFCKFHETGHLLKVIQEGSAGIASGQLYHVGNSSCRSSDDIFADSTPKAS